jgi:hypothetical protein
MPEMTGIPPRRRSRVVFWVAAIAILSAIAATALLANDKRNLRIIAERYHLTWLDLAPVVPPRPPSPTKPPTRPIAVRPAVGKLAPQRFFSDLQAVPGVFLRHWKIAGEDICSRITEAGIAVSKWGKGGLDNETFECSYQTPVSETSTSEQPSLFVIVRGAPKGDIGNVRIKAILPETPAGNELQKKLQVLVRVLIEETQWRDLSDAANQIDELQNVTKSAFGARLVFSHEFGDPRRFNLILDLDSATAHQRAAAAYFDRSKHLALPHGPSRQ